MTHKLWIVYAAIATIICLVLVAASAAEGKHWTLITAWATLATIPAAIGFAEITLHHLGGNETND